MCGAEKRSIEERLRRILPDPLCESGFNGPMRRIIAGDPPLVILDLADATWIVLAYTARWTSPGELEPVGELTGQAAPSDEEKLTSLIRRAAEHRSASFLVCGYCGHRTPPEWMHDKATCHGCAERELGIVH